MLPLTLETWGWRDYSTFMSSLCMRPATMCVCVFTHVGGFRLRNITYTHCCFPPWRPIRFLLFLVAFFLETYSYYAFHTRWFYDSGLWYSANACLFLFSQILDGNKQVMLHYFIHKSHCIIYCNILAIIFVWTSLFTFFYFIFGISFLLSDTL